MSSLLLKAALVDKRAKSLHPVPFFNMAQKDATYFKIIWILTLWREKIKKKVTEDKTVDCLRIVRSLIFVFVFAICDNSSEELSVT